MALSIAFDRLDRDGDTIRRRQWINRTAPATDPTSITIALPMVPTIAEISAEAITDGTESPSSAPEVAIAKVSANVFQARIKTQADKVLAIHTVASGF